jgi:uncharacterized protein (DUF4415 family)
LTDIQHGSTTFRTPRKGAPGIARGATINEIRRTRGVGKKPAKEQVAIRLDPDVLGALGAGDHRGQLEQLDAQRVDLGVSQLGALQS